SQPVGVGSATVICPHMENATAQRIRKKGYHPTFSPRRFLRRTQNSTPRGTSSEIMALAHPAKSGVPAGECFSVASWTCVKLTTAAIKPIDSRIVAPTTPSKVSHPPYGLRERLGDIGPPSVRV